MKNTLRTIKALADGNRLRVVAALMGREELCVCQITAMLQLAPATVSRHMSILQTADLVASRKAGRWVYYRLHKPFPAILAEWLRESLSGSPDIEADRRKLKEILACDPSELCGREKSA